MMPASVTQDWRDDLPAFKGDIRFDVPMRDLTWFRVGGPAAVLFRPADEADLIAFLKALPEGVPVLVLGVGSNLLVRDGGFDGAVIRLGRAFSAVEIEGDLIRAGAGASDVNVAMAAARAGLSGLEFMRGIPGTVGGALRMNAGAYGREVADVLVSARAIDGQGRVHDLTPADMGFTYRHSAIPEDWVFLSALLKGAPGDKDAIRARMQAIGQERETSQPVKSATGGSTFKNPSPETRAWQVIDAAGCRGLKRGGAQVSPQHCNFLINTGGATAADLEELGEEVRRRVKETQGIDLEWEIRRVGRGESGKSLNRNAGEAAS